MKSFYFRGYYKTRQSVITIYDSLDYYILPQHVITIYDGYVITIHDTCYYISRQVLQYTTSVITIHDRYYNSRHYYISRQHAGFSFSCDRKIFLKRSFSKKMTPRQSCDLPAWVFLKHNSKMTDYCVLNFPSVVWTENIWCALLGGFWFNILGIIKTIFSVLKRVFFCSILRLALGKLVQIEITMMYFK